MVRDCPEDRVVRGIEQKNLTPRLRAREAKYYLLATMTARPRWRYSWPTDGLAPNGIPLIIGVGDDLVEKEVSYSNAAPRSV